MIPRIEVLSVRINGKSADDFQFFGTTRVRIDVLGGNDLLSGGAGRDKLMGEAGDDSLEGGDGSDRLYSANNSDNSLIIIDDKNTPRAGTDRVDGGAGRDFATIEGYDTLVKVEGHQTLPFVTS